MGYVGGVYLGYGITISRAKIIKKLKIKIDADLDEDDINSELQSYFRNKKVKGIKLDYFYDSHDEEGDVIIGVFVCVANDYGIGKLDNKIKGKINDTLNENPFLYICEEVFGMKPRMMSYVEGCRCCS